MNPLSTETAHKSIIYKYYAYSILSNLWFVGAVWLYFYRLYITDQDVGIIDGLAFLVALIIEVPSGAIADAIGRKKIVMLGQVLSGVGILIQALGQSYETILI
jgi:MFS family permease